MFIGRVGALDCDVYNSQAMEYGGAGKFAWCQESQRLYEDHRIFLLGDCTLTRNDQFMWVFVRESDLGFFSGESLQQIDYFHGVGNWGNLVTATMIGDGEEYAYNMINLTGWVSRAIVKFQRQFRTRRRAKKLTSNRL